MYILLYQLGIKDLNAFLKEHTPGAVTNLHFNELAGKKGCG